MTEKRNIQARPDGTLQSLLPCVLTLNAGSSSIRFAVYELGPTLRRRLAGKLDRIGARDATLSISDPTTPENAPTFRRVAAPSHRAAVDFLLRWLKAQPVFPSIKAVGHRVVHGLKHSAPERITPRLLSELRRLTPYAPEHLPREIALITAVHRRHPRLPQVA